MTHWKACTERKYLFAFDLAGQDKTLTIDRVEAGELEGEKGRKSKKPMCYFRNVPKPLALNATNCKTLAKLFGSNEIESWAGQRVTLYPTTTEMNSETVECIRIRPRKPPAATQRRQDLNVAPIDDSTRAERPDVSDAGDPEPPEPGSSG